jgi:predicted Ser/Thr protein kinase
VPELAEGTEFAGCRVEGVIARGGMGVVYRATQRGLGRRVALKLLASEYAADPEFRARFEREWQMAAAIDHPHIIPVYAAGEEEGTLYLVLRYVAGADLQQLLRRSGPLPPARAAAVVAQVASALDAAHAAGLVHRDVKPANVLLDGEHVYLTDFGLTRPVDGGVTITQTGRWMGTVHYASPEQLGSGRTEARSDVYALGCTLYAALTGGPPFPRDTVSATLLAHLHDPPPLPSQSGAPRAFDAVVARALAKDPVERYPSTGDLARAALAAAAGEAVTEVERSVARGEAAPAKTRVMPSFAPPVPVPPPSSAASPVRIRRRAGTRRLAALGLTLLAAAGAGLAVSAVVGDGRDTASTGPVDADEARAVVDRFARAYEREDGTALGRTLTANVERVVPAGRQRGRAAVVSEYADQFRSMPITGYDLREVDIEGGGVARAEGRYVVSRKGESSFGGHIVFGVIRERGRPRIDLIAATPTS